ncbi:MAG: hypothetical protein ABJB11_09570 [Ferruginibacter sp.]
MYNIAKYALLLFLPIVMISCNSNESGAGNTGSAELMIASANGIGEFAKVKSIEFTFNIEKDSAHMERHWKWMPTENMVIFYDKADSVQFKRMDTTTAELKKLNGQFTNDEYWLLFPLHLKWDKGYTFTDDSTATGPVSEKAYHKYTVQYNNKDGFTPGDMYELYTDDNHMIQEWAYHKTGSKEPSLMTTWEDYQDFNGLKIAKEHKTKDGKFSLYFTGITIEH